MSSAASSSTVLVGEVCYFCSRQANKRFTCPKCSGPCKVARSSQEGNEAITKGRYYLCDECLRRACEFCTHVATKADISDDSDASDLSMIADSVGTASNEVTPRAPVLVLDWMRGSSDSSSLRTRSFASDFCAEVGKCGEARGTDLVIVAPDLLCASITSLPFGRYLNEDDQQGLDSRELRDFGFSWLFIDYRAKTSGVKVRLSPIGNALANGFKLLILGDEIFKLEDANLKLHVSELCKELTKYAHRMESVVLALDWGATTRLSKLNVGIRDLRIALWRTFRPLVEAGLRIIGVVDDCPAPSELLCSDGFMLKRPSSMQSAHVISAISMLRNTVVQQQAARDMTESSVAKERKLCVGYSRLCRKWRQLRFKCAHCVVCSSCQEVLAECPVCGLPNEIMEELQPESIGLTASQPLSLPSTASPFRPGRSLLGAESSSATEPGDVQHARPCGRVLSVHSSSATEPGALDCIEPGVSEAEKLGAS